jgi:geranyl-CoA carboxylase alpha subunit
MRVDHGLRQGGEISPFYDSMQAKLIATGATREEARRKLLQMLDETVLLGVGSNRDFLTHIIGHPVFASGHFSTGFIAEHCPSESIGASRQPDLLHRALAAALLYRTAADELRRNAEFDDELLGWQSSAPATVTVKLKLGETATEARVKPLGGKRCEVVLPDGTTQIELTETSAPDVGYVHEGIAGRAAYARQGDTLWLSHRGLTLRYDDVTLAAARKVGAGSDGRLVAPMDGRIIAVFVEAGAAVRKGQSLAVLEAMKMELQVASSVDGVVETVSCQPGQQVKARQLLIGLKPDVL